MKWIFHIIVWFSLLLLIKSLEFNDYLSYGNARHLQSCLPVSGALSFDCKFICDDVPTPVCIRMPNSDLCAGRSGVRLNDSSTCPDSDPDKCTYTCLKSSPKRNDANVFRFFVPFNTTKSASVEEKIAALPDNRGTYPWQSNKYITFIQELNVPTMFTFVEFIGGSSFESINGIVSSLEFYPKFLQNSPQVTKLAIRNIDLKGYQDITDLISDQLERVVFSNCLLSEISPALSQYNLKALDVSLNYLTQLPPDFTIPTLEELRLSANTLKSFDANFPNLKYLDLNNNSFTAIPPIVYELEYLGHLDMSNNPIKSGVYTSKQHKFLSGIPSLILPTAIDPLPCSADDQRILSGNAICLDDTIQEAECKDCSGFPWIYVIIGVCVAIIIGIIIALCACGCIKCQNPWNHDDDETDDERSVNTYSRPVETSRNTFPTNTPSYMSNSQSLGSSQAMHNSKFTPSMSNSQSLGSSQAMHNSKFTPSLSKQTHSVSSSLSENLSRGSVVSNKDRELLPYMVNQQEITDVRPIGQGSYTIIWLVTYNHANMLACKRLRSDKNPREYADDFLAKIKISTKLDHPCIVRFSGIVWISDFNFQALYEYMEQGDLQTLIITNKLASGMTSAKLQIAISIINALVYAHSFDPKYLHGNLTSRSVLLSNSFEAKLSGFTAPNQALSNFPTIHSGLWAAPEILLGQAYDESCDIYSFGIILSELETSSLPFGETRKSNMNDSIIKQSIVQHQLKPEFTPSCPQAYKDLALRCLSSDPLVRPNARETVFNLRPILQSFQMQDTTKSFHF